MRLFFALELPEPVAYAIDARIAELRARLPHRAIGWETRAKLHLTLRFLGEVDELRAAQLIEEGRAIARATAPFAVAFRDVDTFRDEAIPRVVFVAVAEPNPELHALAARFGDEPRGYHPHVTIARVRHSAEAGRAVASALTEPSSIAVPAMTVTSLSLMETRGGRHLRREAFTLAP